MKPNLISVLFLHFFLTLNVYGLEIITAPEPKMIPQGDSYTLSCETDEPFEICKWSHMESEKECRVTKEGGRYIALPLNNSQDESHGVRATLIINAPTEDDLENVNYLEVSTTKGAQQYHFHLNLLEEPIEETTFEDDLEIPEYEYDDGLGAEDDVKGMGVGSVIAIVIVIAVICLIIGCVVYSKRTGKCCFEQPYGPAKQSDHTEDLEPHANIIKNGGNQDNKLTKSVEAGVDETDKEKQEV